MKLCLNCIRDIMFHLEEHLSITDELEVEEISVFDLPDSLNYPVQELANTLMALYEAGFIEIDIDNGNNRILQLDIIRITYSGYQFIESIRPETVWKKVTSAGKHIGSFSIDLITQVAARVLATMINDYLTGQSNL